MERQRQFCNSHKEQEPEGFAFLRKKRQAPDNRIGVQEMLIKAVERNRQKRRVHDAGDLAGPASQHRRAEESGSAKQWIPRLLHPRDIRKPEAEYRRIRCEGLKLSSDNDEQVHASILGLETVYFGQAVLDCDERGWKASVFGSVCEESS